MAHLELLDQLHDQLHVWTMRLEPPDEAVEHLVSPDDEALLSDVERRRHRRYLRASDRATFLASHVLVRRTLSRYVDVPPEEWTFACNRYGRPEIAHPAAPQGLRFNLAHTEGLVALLVHDDVDSGVDVERVGTVDDLYGVAEMVFADPERDALRSLPVEEQEARFYRLWTLKEAFIKARGMGLALPLRDFWFAAHDPMDLQLGCLGSIERHPEAWSFTVWHPSPDHALATACRSGRGRPAREVTFFDRDAEAGPRQPGDCS